MIIKVYVQTHFAGSMDECQVELDDSATAEEIERAALEAMFGMIEWGWFNA